MESTNAAFVFSYAAFLTQEMEKIYWNPLVTLVIISSVNQECNVACGSLSETLIFLAHLVKSTSMNWKRNSGKYIKVTIFQKYFLACLKQGCHSKSGIHLHKDEKKKQGKRVKEIPAPDESLTYTTYS